jgi:uncharacterized protein
MQVQNDPPRRQGRSREVQGANGAASKSAEQTSPFKQIVSAGAQSIRDSLDQLMQELDDASQQLLQNPSEAQLTRYTQAVRAFVRKSQGDSMAVSKQFDRHNRLYMVVREVDVQLSQLTEQVLNHQERALEMAARIQEIRGILLDMYI